MLEYRYAELRQDGRRLLGTAIRYGEIATLPFGHERFEPGAFAPLSDVILNVQHDRGRPLARTSGGGLVLHDDAAELRIEAALPKTQEADDTLSLVKAGVLRGLSIEFHATEERMDGNVRVIEQARLSGVSVVDSGAYPGSTVEARRRGGRRGSRGGRLASYRGRIPADRELDCQCAAGDCDKVVIESGALDSAIPKAKQADVLGVLGDYKSPLASKQRKGLRFWRGKDGSLEYAIDIPDTEAGRRFMEQQANFPMIGRPIVNRDRSTIVQDGTIERVKQADLRAISITVTDASRGWPALVPLKAGDPGFDIDDVPDNPGPARRRARVWL